MNLKDLQKMRLQFKKEGKNKEANIIMMLIDYSQKLAKEVNNEVNEIFIQKGLKKYIKQVEDSIKNGIESAKEELEFLKELGKDILPKELSEEEIENILKQKINEIGDNFGKIMGSVKNIPGINMQKTAKILKNLIKK